MDHREIQSLVEARDDQFVRHAYEAADLEAAVDNRAEQLAADKIDDLSQWNNLSKIIPPDEEINCDGVRLKPLEMLLFMYRNADLPDAEVARMVRQMRDKMIEHITNDEQVRAQALADTIGDLEDRYYSER
jgi:hypothetical protein